jgi:hypothetical protein
MERANANVTDRETDVSKSPELFIRNFSGLLPLSDEFGLQGRCRHFSAIGGRREWLRRRRVTFSHAFQPCKSEPESKRSLEKVQSASFSALWRCKADLKLLAIELATFRDIKSATLRLLQSELFCSVKREKRFVMHCTQKEAQKSI